MTTEGSEARAAVGIVPTRLPSFARHKILFYVGILVILLAFGSPSGGLIDIPISFLLKNKLKLQAYDVAQFRLVASLPLYLSFVFGFTRDIWSPFGMRDRGLLLMFGGVSAALYILFAFTSIGYLTLLLAIITLTASFLFVASAQNGLTALVGQRHAMTGQISAVWNILLSVPTVAALLAGGVLSNVLEDESSNQAVRILFLLGAAIMCAVAIYSIWKPREVFDNEYLEQSADEGRADSVKRLARHWPIYPSLLIWSLWNFAPGSATPLQYHLQNALHASDAQWGQWSGIFAASFIPTFIAYGFLCKRFALKTILIWGTGVAVPQMVPLLFIHSITGALVAAVPMGLMGGIATGAYLDLIIRSCPRGLEGTTLMLSNSLYFAVTRFGDVLGTHLYDQHGGFGTCVFAITIVYALILPALLIIPNYLIATADEQITAYK
jgi:MFS family permease